MKLTHLNNLIIGQIQTKKILKKILLLLKGTQKNPFSGLGKPEPLKHDLQGYWSKRINQEHRLVYQVDDESIIIISCRYHYVTK